MADESIHLPNDNQSIEYHLVTLFEKLEALKNDRINNETRPNKLSMQLEIRTLEFWRSVTCECLASFTYVFIVCGAAAGGSENGISVSSVLLATALASGFTMTTLSQCFGHISGANVNPAVSIAMGITKKISLLRTIMFVTAQCGGGIAGAAFLYGITTTPGYQGNLVAVIANSANTPAWERFGIELILTFVVVLTYFVSTDNYRRWTGTSSLTIGASYAACSFVSMPYLNPARSLGPSFVLNKWENHWVYWLGPAVGSIASGLIYNYILNPNKQKIPRESTDGDSSSIQSDEDAYDDLDKPATVPKFHGSTYNTYRPPAGNSGTGGGNGYCPSLTSTSLYSAPPTKLERVESLYGGTKSLYCKSPPLTRANLNRSQSVYTKSNNGVNRDILPKPGPLVPAQSLYPMRLNQQSHVQNQNVQNQMQQRSESIYGIRGGTSGAANRTDNFNANGNNAYNCRANNSSNSDKYEENVKPSRGNRPESMYGMIGTGSRRGQSNQSDDSSYGSYHGTSNRSNTTGTNTYISSNSSTYNTKISGPTVGTFSGRTTASSEVRQSPPTQILSAPSGSNSYHHNLQQQQHSPNSQY